MRSEGQLNSEMRKLDNIDRWLGQVESTVDAMGKAVRDTRESCNKALSNAVDKHKAALKSWEADFSKQAKEIVAEIKKQYRDELSAQANRAFEVLAKRTNNRVAEIDAIVAKYKEYR
ncbi:MAG: hypothetical protein ACI4MY_04980 [Christensenellales bacterium]